MTPGLRGLLLIATAAAIWGTTGIAAKLLFTSSALPALTLGFLRLAIAAPLFLILWRRFDPPRPRPAEGRKRSRSMVWLLLLGLTQAGYQAQYLLAVDLAGAALATLVALCLSPVIVALVAVPLMGERFNGLIVTGLAGAIFGTALLVLGGETVEADHQRLLGVGIAAIAAALYAAFTLVSRHTAQGYGPYQIACICFSTGALLLLPLVLARDGLSGLAALTPVQILLILYVGVVPTCLGYVCFFNGMKVTSATTSSIVVTLEPLFAALLAWLILDERLGAWGLAGAVTLVAAVLCASRGSTAQR